MQTDYWEFYVFPFGKRIYFVIVTGTNYILCKEKRPDIILVYNWNHM